MLVGDEEYVWQYHYIVRFGSRKLLLSLDYRVRLSWREILRTTAVIWSRA